MIKYNVTLEDLDEINFMPAKSSYGIEFASVKAYWKAEGKSEK
jgi:hypothetical protein